MMTSTVRLLRSPYDQRTRVLVVSAHRLLTEALGAVLAYDAELELVGVHIHPRLTPEHVQQSRPDVVVLHHAVLDPGVAQIVADLRAAAPHLKVILLTDVFDREAVLACIQAGAAGYLTTEQSPGELARLITRAQGGEVLFEPELLLNLLTQPRRPVNAPRGLAYQQPGPRELEVLQALAGGATTEEVADVLGISVHTVRTHLRNVMAKLEVHSKLEAVVVALKENLIQLQP